MTVSDLMRTDVVTVTPETRASEVGQQMRDQNVGSVIVEEDDRPVGIITLDDLHVLLASEQRRLADVVAGEMPPY